MLVILAALGAAVCFGRAFWLLVLLGEEKFLRGFHG